MTKTELGALPHWDLSNVFPSLDSPELKNATTACEKQIAALERFLNRHDVRKDARRASVAGATEIIEGYLARCNDAMRQMRTVRVYIYSFVAVDSHNQTARTMLSAVEPLGVRLSQIDTRFAGWLGTLGDRLEAVIKRSPAVLSHAYYLRETAAQSRFLMSEAEENLASELSLSGASLWQKLQNNTVSQLTVNFSRDGKAEALSMPALINLVQHDPDGEVRREAYEAELAAWKTVEEPLAAAMNGVKGAALVLNRHRGRKDAVHSAIDDSHIDRKTLDAMLGAMHDSFPDFRRYLRAKASHFGHAGGLPWWDLMAPIGRNERVYAWDDARDFVLSNFERFSPRLHAMSERAFERNWIDAEQRPGKRAGAFCISVPGVDESRVLCNFDGSLDQVSTIAHELGHAFHNQCHVGMPSLRTLTPMTLAETASIFCETLITDAALEQASSDAEALTILETDLIGKTQIVVDITSRYLFETEVFKRREKSEVSADDLCDIMLRCQAQTYGDGLDARHMHKYMWTWKPHYYYSSLSFYNFPYAFGLLFGMGLYAIYQERGASFVADYEALLSSTGEADAATLAKRFKIDIRSKKFWKNSLDLIAERIDRYCALIASAR